ncbi:HNH endonuclease [Aeromonas veronii]|uniref:HNH endonuclease n=1 Tax=Aeromonas veronii TaxID=654 RepID=UPI0039F70BDA
MKGHRTVNGSFPKSLVKGIELDCWRNCIDVAGGISIDSLLLSNSDFLKSQIISSTARLSCAAFIPHDWEVMRSGPRFDAIYKIVTETTNIKNEAALILAQKINCFLSNKLNINRKVKLSNSVRNRLIEKTNRCCHICGRRFSIEEIMCFLDGNPQSARHSQIFEDRLKPIYSYKHGWSIALDHINPISGSGIDDEDNLALACHYCNSMKKDYISIFDMSNRSLYASSNISWKIHATRLISTSCCITCGRGNSETELTVSRFSKYALNTLENFYVTCYEHSTEENRFVCVDK